MLKQTLFNKFVLSVVILFSTNSWGKEYYVDNTVSTQGNGSLRTPWRSINEGIKHLKPGDILYIRGDNKGRRYLEAIRPSQSGTKDRPITVKAFQQEKVIIQSPDSNLSTIRLDTDWWIFENLIIDHNMYPKDAIRVKGSYNIFRKLEVKNGSRDGFDLSGSQQNIIEGCKIHDFNLPNEDAHCIVIDKGTNCIIRKNEIFNCSGDCIQVYKGSVYNLLIEANHLYTTLSDNSENAIDIKRSSKVIIRKNKMHGFRRSHGSDGVAIVCHHPVRELLIEENIIYDSEGGIRTGKECVDVTIQYNVIYDIFSTNPNKCCSGYGIQIDGTGDIKIYHNTFYSIPWALFWLAGEIETIKIHNNLFVKAGRGHDDEPVLNGVIAVSHNGYFDTELRLGKVWSRLNETNIIEGAQFTGFVAPERGDFSLKKDSIVIDKGIDIGLPFKGKAPDLGAFEYDPSYECKKDTDCKGTKICRNNKCIDPEEPPKEEPAKKCIDGGCLDPEKDNNLSKGCGCTFNSSNISFAAFMILYFIVFVLWKKTDLDYRLQKRNYKSFKGKRRD
jgi:hypothetical protein